MTRMQNTDLTPEQKEKNRQYLLDHFEEYILDSHENFVNVAPDTEGDEWFFCFEKPKLPPGAFEEIREKLFETILREKENYEVVYDADLARVEGFQNKLDKRRMGLYAFGWERGYEIVGELGWRKNVWRNYEEIIKVWKAREKYFRENITHTNNNFRFTPPKNPNQPDNPNKSNQNDFPQPGEQKPTREKINPAPPPTDIQNQYNSDKDKERIENNSDLDNSETQQAAQELLKIVIAAELLIKENQFNPEILVKLLAEKEDNSPIFQIVNQEGRAEQAINQLESIQKASNQNNNPTQSPEKSPKSPPSGIIFGSLFLAVIIGLGVIILVRNRRIKWIKRSKKI